MFCCCASTKGFVQNKHVSKQIGNIKNSHKAIQFISLLDKEGRVVSYLTDWNPNQIKENVERLLERCIQFRQSQKQLIREIGFDYSKETYIKANNCLYMMNEIDDYLLIIYMEMNELKIEFFDCENFIHTIDDFIVTMQQSLNEKNS